MDPIRCNPSSSLRDLLYEQSSAAEVDEVFVAVNEDISDGMSTLLWAMENLANDKSRVVIARVYSPTRAIHKLGVEARRSKYINLMRERAEENMDEYALTGRRRRKDLEIDRDKVAIEMEDVAEGLAKLIALHGITKLVMGAAADQHYSKEMKTPKSKKALKLMETVAPSCKIWFTCNGHLICTSEMNEKLPAISQSPVQSNTTPSSVCSISSLITSTSLKNEASSKGYNSGTLFESAKIDTDEESYVEQQEVYTEAELWKDGTDEESNKRRKDELDLLPALQRAKEMENLYQKDKGQQVDMDEKITRQSEETKRQRDELYYELKEIKEKWLMQKLHYVSEEANRRRSTRRDLLSAIQRGKEFKKLYDNEIRERKTIEETLVRQMREIEEMKIQCETIYDELNNAEKENDLLEQRITEMESALEDHKQKLGKSKYLREELEKLYHHEIRQRKTIEETLVRQTREMEETKIQCETIHDELHDAEQEKAMLKLRITEMESVLEDHKQKLAKSKYLLEELEKLCHHEIRQRKTIEETLVRQTREMEETKIPRDAVVTAAEVVNTEFSVLELEQATRQFDKPLKIGEGGFGCVYKGSLRSTTVAIKLLHPESLQGHSEFHQEVAVLSRVRHPNLVMLIGSCREAFGLVYEFLPNGNLEERLACKNNTPPLTWQVRTRIIAEMCSALTFLHSSKPHPVVHGDLKPDNILLDANLVSKLGDFGLCRLLIQSNTTTRLYRTTTPRGTFAYMDPEFMSTGEQTTRSDIYSFGIIILQILTGRPPQKIAEVVQDAMHKGELHSVIDPSAGNWPFVQANQLARLGLQCAETSRRRRPDLAQDVWMVVEPLMKAASMTVRRPTFATGSSADMPTPSDFICPIFQDIMSDPHIAADGFTYDAEAIRGWLDSGHDTSPMTNLKLLHGELTPNRGLRSVILEWQEQCRHHEDWG